MKRYKHNLSNYRIFSCDMGELVPIGVTEVLPGDTFQHRTSCLIRLLPLVSPVMHPVNIRIHSFFVPNRIVWEGWEDFITGENLIDTVPTLTNPAPPNNRLTDFMGIPPVTNLVFNDMPIRCYNKIFNEFYRDQDLVEEVDEFSTAVQSIAWEKDYFSAARPWPQKGPAVTLPLGSRAPIMGLGLHPGVTFGLTNQAAREAGGDDVEYAKAAVSSGTNNIIGEEDPDNPGYPNFYADLSSAEAINVNDLREAFALQRYQEARARYGSRYTEYLRYLGVRSSDARLQRPEYLGGGRKRISFSEVLQTAPDDTGPGQSFVGDLHGHGIGAVRTKRYRRYFEEHGHVLTLLSIRPKVVYTQALHKKWLRQTKEDYYQKELEAIGQQEVPSQEIYAEVPANEDVFGYVDRYREYREEPSQVGTEMRELTNYWHMARDFQSAPVLNESFITCDPTKRIHAVQTNDVLQVMVNHSLQARRMVNSTAHSHIR